MIEASDSNLVTQIVGYGLGMRTPCQGPRITDLGWAVPGASNHTCVPWLYKAIRVDLLCGKVNVPIETRDDNPKLTYESKPRLPFFPLFFSNPEVCKIDGKY